MTILEYTSSLQDEGLTSEEIFVKVQEWKKNNTEEEPVVKEAAEVEVKTNDSKKDPGLESDSNTGSKSESGFSRPVGLTNKTGGFGTQEFNTNVLNNIRKKEYEQYTSVAKPEEVITKNGYDLKYDNKGEYYYKKQGSDDNSWKTYEDKQSEANLSIAAQFGHSSFKLKDSQKTNTTLQAGEKYLIDIDGNLVVGNPKETTLTPEQLKLEQEFITATSLDEDDKNKIKTNTNKWFDNSTIKETKKENYTITIPGGGAQIRTREVPTGNIIPNPEWAEAEIKSKQLWDALDPKPEGITEQEWIEQNMKSTYSEELSSKKERDLIETWIEKQEGSVDLRAKTLLKSMFGAAFFAGDIFDRGEKQKAIEKIQKTRKLDIDNASQNVSDFATTAKNTIEGLNAQMELIAKAKYQTPDQLTKGKALLNDLRKKRDEVLTIYKEKVSDLDDMMLDPKYDNIPDRLDYLSRNFNSINILTTNVKVAAVNIGTAMADVTHMALNAPNEFGLTDPDKNPLGEAGVRTFNRTMAVINPNVLLASKLLDSQPYKKTREAVKGEIENYVDQTMSGIAHAQSLSDLEDGADWGRYFSTLIGSQAINTAILFTTGGAALPILTASAVGTSYGEMEKDNKQMEKAYQDYIDAGGNPNSEFAPSRSYTPFQMYTVAMGNGLLEYGSERISLGIINRAKKAYQASGSSIRQGFSTQISSLLTGKGATRAAKGTGLYVADTASESLAEGGVEFGGNLFDRYVLGKDVNLFDGVPDAMFSGGIMSGGLYKAPALFANISYMVQGPDTNTKIANNRQKILDIENTLMANPEMSEFNRARLNNQIVDLTRNSSNEINKTLNRFSEMDRSDIDALSDIELNVYKKRKAIEEVNSDPNFNNKEAEIEIIKNEILKLEIEKNKVLKPFIEADAKQSKKLSPLDGSGSFTEFNVPIVELTNRKIQEGADVVAEQLGDTGITRFDTTEDIVGAFETLKAEGINLEIETNEDGSIKDAKDQGYGIIATLPNGTQQIIINNASSEADGVIPADKHEILHAFASKMDPAKLAQMGKDLKAKLDSDPSVEISDNTKGLLNEYQKDLNNGDITETTFYEEVMAVTSDALTTGDIKITDPSQFVQTWNFLETIGWKQSFKDGDQVIDFLKDFNKDVLSRKGLSQKTLDTAEVDMGLATEVDLGAVKESRKLTPEQDQLAQDKVKEIQKEQEEADRLAKKYKLYKKDSEGNVLKDKKGDPVLDPPKGAKQQRLEKELAEQIKAPVDSFVESRTKALYDPIAADNKRNVTRQEFVQSMKSDIATMINNEFKAKQPLEKFITSRGFVRANSLAKRLGIKSVEQGIDQSIDTASNITTKTDGDVKTETETRTAQSPRATTQFTPDFVANLDVNAEGKTEAEVNEEIQKQFDEAIAKDLKAMGPVTTFGQTKDIGPALAALMEKATQGRTEKVVNGEKKIVKTPGIPAKVFMEKSKNIAKKYATSGALTAVKQYLDANAQRDFNNLPDAFAPNSGKATFIPENVKKALYKKNDKDQFVLDKSKTIKDYKALLGDMVKPVYRASEAQTIKGLIALSLRNRIFEQAVPDAIARKTTGVKFSNKKQPKTSGLKEIQQIANQEALERVRNDKSLRRKILVDVFGSIFPIEVLKKSVNFSLGNKVSSLAKRGVGLDMITDSNKILDPKLKQEAKDLIAKSEILELESIKKDARNNTPDFNEDQIAQVKEALGQKDGAKYELRLKNLDLHNAGVDLLIDAELEIAKNSEEAFAVLTDFMYHYALNANQNRNQATNAGVESGAVITENGKTRRRREVTDEHVFQAIEHAKAKLQLYRNIINAEKSGDKKKIAAAKNSLKRYKEWIKTNYIQVALKKENDIVAGNLVDLDGNVWRKSGGTSHPILIEALNKAIKSGKDADWDAVPSSMLRYFSGYGTVDSNGNWSPSSLNPNNLEIFGKNVAVEFNVEVASNLRQNPNVVQLQGKLINKIILTEAGILTGGDAVTRAKARKLLDLQLETEVSKSRQSKKINNLAPNNLKIEGDQDANTVKVVNELNTLDKALAEGRKLEKPVKKIRVFDFDDTLARSNSKVIVIKPMSQIDTDMLDIVARRKFKKEFENLPSRLQNFDRLNEQQKLEVLKETPGATTEINATQFAEQAADLEAQGATFDFSQFEQVIDGKKGPLFDVAKKIADTRGTEDLFILTARPQTAAGPIKAFMKALGVDIPLGNITGLADGTAAAKGRWIAGKAAEGYNDFYFADDAGKNVKAVKEVLDQIDVKSKVQQARASKKQTFDTVVNDMIQDSSGIESYKTFSAAKARTVGRDKGRFDWLTMASSAEDFKGLLYSLLGNGKKGEAQYEFLKTNLIDPYGRAEDSITQAKIAAANDFMALKEQFPGIPKTLETETGVGKFNYQHALRVYMWTQQGMSIPGLSKADARKLNKFITDDAKLQSFADQLISIQKGKPYPEPGKDWLGGNLTTDIIGGINKVNRKEYLQEWQENVDIIFSPENLNKMEAAYGTRWRKALENTLTRMKAGTNRLGYNDQTSAVLDWVNNSVGAVMFLNTRSALLQTISAVNFINWGDNNIIAAGAAFANQKQFWGDFMTLMNSDYLVQRRNGLKINVSESEIADAVKDSKNKVNAAISYLLSKGFVLTRYADSFAIASGGATFYRNRMNKYIKEGMDPKLAKEQAFQDFRQIAEESQQSSSPDKISMQQASAAGRVILNWANTPMQYVRIQKRAIQDLIAGRGDAKVHMSRIAYYGVIQNLIFNAMQQALFAIGFGDDEDDEEKSAAKKKQDNNKIARVANGMIDSQLKGLGIAGAGMVAVKNTLMKIYEESGKQRPEYEKAAIEALSFSPAISSKYRKIVGGLKSFSWNMKEMKQKGFSLDNPAYLAGAQIITAATNIPIDRVIKKANNIRGILSEQSQMWQKVILFGGWSTWDVGLPYYGGWDKPVEPTPAELKRQEIDVMKKDTSTADQTQMLLDLGLDKKQIKALRYEDARVKKIIELQNKNKEK